MRIFLSRRARTQAEAEIRAQLAAFRRTGLRLDHLDGHHHFHLHPTVQEILVRLAPELGISAIRVPDEPAPMRSDVATSELLRRWLAALPLRGRAGAMKRRLARAGIRFNDAILGLRDSGQLDAARVRVLLAGLPDGVTELYLHPATKRWGGIDALPDHYRPESEFTALLDPSVRAAVEASGAALTTFADLVEESRRALANLEPRERELSGARP
jgi:hopanoid biosynthesis associated protein HpnK